MLTLAISGEGMYSKFHHSQIVAFCFSFSGANLPTSSERINIIRINQFQRHISILGYSWLLSFFIEFSQISIEFPHLF